MGFHLRKSFSIGGVRFNLSNSGIGASVGVKGCRIGIDGKGRTYVGGGKGIVRYRQYYSNNLYSSSYSTKDNNEFPKELKIVTIGKILWCVLLTPIALFFLLGALGSLFTSESSLFLPCLIFGVISLTPYLTLIPSKKIKYFNLAEMNFEQKDYLTALENYDKSYSESKKYITKYYISSKMINCYELLEDWENELKFLSTHGFINNFRVHKVKCLYNLENWEELIKYLQNDFDEEEIKKHPATYYCLLSECFIKLGKNQLALETMLIGPVKSRTMNIEMCAYRYQLAQCYELNNDYKNALKQYNKIYAFDIGYEDVAQRIEELGSEEK